MTTSDSEEASGSSEDGVGLENGDEELSNVVSWHGRGLVVALSGLGGEILLREKFRAGPSAEAGSAEATTTTAGEFSWWWSVGRWMWW